MNYLHLPFVFRFRSLLLPFFNNIKLTRLRKKLFQRFTSIFKKVKDPFSDKTPIRQSVSGISVKRVGHTVED